MQSGAPGDGRGAERDPSGLGGQNVAVLKWRQKWGCACRLGGLRLPVSLGSLCLLLHDSPAEGAQLGVGRGLFDGREMDRAIARLAGEGGEGRPFQLPALRALRPDGEIVYSGMGVPRGRGMRNKLHQPTPPVPGRKESKTS